ncbi:PG1 [Linum perenne]
MKGISMAALLVAIVIYGGMSANAQPQPIEITPISRLLTAKPAPAGKEPAPAGGAPAAAGGGPGGVFDVMKYGAVAGGDVSQAMLKAWTEACASASPSKVVVPPGDYTAGVTKFVGPCKAPIQFEINGIIKAPPSIPGDSWLSIEDVTDLRLIGTGTLDGQGAQCWASKGGPQTAGEFIFQNLRFQNIINGWVEDITSKDSKFFHMATLDCNNMTFSHVNVIAPATSVNTDGIHLSRSQHITITDSTIGTGDDCVSMIDNLDTITIQNTKCGPSHGISIGSLGKYQKEGPVKNIFVRQCTIANSDNGIRIKSWPDKFATACSGIHFEDITLENVENPIIIDQQYCPNGECTTKVHLNVQMSNIDITFNGGPGVAICQNVKPVITGIMNPPGC